MAKEVNIKMIEANLQELAGREKLTVTLNSRIKVACSTRFTDKGVYVRLNPKRIKTAADLERQLKLVRQAIGGE